MVEEIYREFKVKRAEVLKQSESKELTPEKEKEILKETISEQTQKSQPITPIQQQAITHLGQKIKDEPKERQIQLLVNMAFEKGVVEAIEVAKSLDSPYLIDELHDILVDELYNKLVTEKKIEKL